MNESEFESIVPYTDEEAVEALARVSKHPAIPVISKYLFPDYPLGTLRAMLQSVTTVDEFQRAVMLKAIAAIVDKTSDGVTYDGVENLQGIKGKFLLVSNHRDIILDPGITQWILDRNKIPMTDICVGSNLLSNQLVEDLLRSNRMIKVIRGISARELYLSSQLLSKYIRQAITSGKASVWVAQKEGRSKNGLDITEQGLLKMFDLSGEKGFEQNFKELNIVPVSISYELEPCDAKKARELYLRKVNGSYTKKKDEDLHSILTGIRQKKGRIHLSFGKPLDAADISLAASGSGNERYQIIMSTLDRRISEGYKLWKNNFIAYDLMTGTKKYSAEYDSEDQLAFLKYLEHKLGKLERNLNRDELRDIFIHIYGNPVLMKEKFGLIKPKTFLETLKSLRKSE